MAAPNLDACPDNRPHNRARLKEEIRRAVRRRNAILQDAATEAVVDCIVLELAAQREQLAQMVENIKAHFGSLSGDHLDRLVHVVTQFYIDENGDVQLPQPKED